jgi:hypothetical protein
MRVCPQCNKRSPKRQCPALRAKICAVCCAAERMVKLACPDSCDYLRSARTEARDREADLRIKEARAGGSLDLGLNQRSMAVAYLTDQAIVATFRGTNGRPLSELNDAEILAALENAIKNLETEDTGLIYEHREASPRVQELSERIRLGIEEVFKQEAAEVRPRRSEVIRALKYVRDAAQAHSKRPDAQPQSYLRYISLFCPWPEEATRDRIIL